MNARNIEYFYSLGLTWEHRIHNFKHIQTITEIIFANKATCSKSVVFDYFLRPFLFTLHLHKCIRDNAEMLKLIVVILTSKRHMALRSCGW